MQKMRPLFQEIGRIALGRPWTEAEQQPGGGQGLALLPLAEGFVEQPPQPVPHDGALAHLAAHHHHQSAGGGVLGLGGIQKFRTGRRHLQHHRGQALAPAAAVEMVEHSASPQAERAGQHHRAETARASDRQARPAAAAAGPDHPAAGVGAHAHPETGHALALAAGSLKGAFGHGSRTWSDVWNGADQGWAPTGSGQIPPPAVNR